MRQVRTPKEIEQARDTYFLPSVEGQVRTLKEIKYTEGIYILSGMKKG
jgi:hypothetical protein